MDINKLRSCIRKYKNTIFRYSLYSVEVDELVSEYYLRKSKKYQKIFYFMIDMVRKYHRTKAGKIKYLPSNDIDVENVNYEYSLIEEKLPEIYLKGLTKTQKFVIIYYYEKNFYMREIGEILGISESAVSLIHKASLKKISGLLHP